MKSPSTLEEDAHYRGDAFARAAICIERLLTTATSKNGRESSMKIDWVTFDPRGPLPPERKYVLIQFSKISCHGFGPVAVGYLRYAGGDRDSPFFVVPGVKRTNDYHEPDVPREEMIVTHWADIFGNDFECPGWHGTHPGFATRPVIAGGDAHEHGDGGEHDDERPRSRVH